ncbi:MAG TPA: hypothetical protein VKU90_06740 [Caulobacteraceae bacterium]|nr:hypothetical protein [Caulobacteraceae bacterium]
MPLKDTPPLDSAPFTFRVVRSPAGWKILGAERLAISTIYLSLEAALAQARAMADVMVSHGQPAAVIVDPEELPE